MTLLTLLSLDIKFSAVLMLGLGVLLSFHLYLLFIARKGTYEWMLGGAGR
jgi:hypothetical protein